MIWCSVVVEIEFYVIALFCFVVLWLAILSDSFHVFHQSCTEDRLARHGLAGSKWPVASRLGPHVFKGR